jgi:hypothetical protein
MANIVVSALATFNGKALKKGKKEISLFEQQVNKLGKTFASVFAARKLLQFSKNAVNAFMADEKAAKSLEVQLRNTGFQFSAPGVENYIGNLQRLTGVLDDELRPAFQQLLTATGSITKSQDALQTALNISAATGKSLTEVSAALTRGFSGNTTGLSRLGAGISKATLKTGNMDKIMGELNKKFAGQAAARLDTYAGKMGLLTVAAEDARETIGKGLLDALSLLGKDTSISSATKLMDDFATSTADAVVGIAVLVNELKKLGNTKVGGVLFDVKNIPVLGAYLAGFSEIGAAQRAKTAPDNKQGRASARIFAQQLRLETKLSEQKKKELALLDAKNKKQTEVDKLSEKFDVERIALMKALGEATDQETKLRIQSKLAILDNNEALAKKYNAEMNAVKGANDLALAFGAAVLSLSSTNADIAKYQNDLAALQDKQIKAGTTVTAPNPADTAIVLSTARSTLDRLQESLPKLLERVQDRAATFDRSDTYIPSSAMPSGVPTTTTAPVINVNVEGSLTSLQEFEITMQDLLLKIYKQNGDLAPAGFIQ